MRRKHACNTWYRPVDRASRATLYSETQKSSQKLRTMLQAEEEEEAEEDPEEVKLEIPDNLDEWEQVARAAAAHPGIAGRISDVIDRLVAADRLVINSPQRAGPSGMCRLTLSPLPVRRDSSNDGEVDENAATSRKRKRPKNPFILDEAAAAEDDENEGEDYELE